MHRKSLLQRIGLFLLLRFVLISGADGQRKCRSNVCFNGGTCVVEDRGSNEAPVFECLCPENYGGTLCEEPMSCTLSCQNSGECRFKEGKPFCSCKHGFGGALCQNKVGCQQSGCPENEICLLDLAENEFKCQKDKCKDRPCKNHANCRSIPNDYLCECSNKWKGKNCTDDINECEEDDPCLNGSECKNTIGDFTCVCPPSFTGKICEQRSGFCVQKPCKHGRCEELDNNFRCICDENFHGPTCDRMKPTLSCEKPRVLVETESGVSKCLLCPEGSKDCENFVEDCMVDGLDCKNDGICLKNGDGTTFCKCMNEFSGRWCENPIAGDQPLRSIECTQNFCHSGVCSNEDGYPKCTCLESQTGQFCQLDCKCPRDTVCRENIMKPGQVDCLRVESLSSITNLDSPSNLTPFASFSFVDLPDFQFEVANISSCDDCLNAQKCVFADKRLMCLCPANFGGPVCAERTNSCASMKCSGNQVCRLRRTSIVGILNLSPFFGDTPYCTCPDGTFGTNCQRKLPPATFNSNSVAVIQVPTQPDNKEGEFSLEFTFRSTVPNTHLASGESILNELDFLLELVDGYLNLRLADHTITDLLELRLNDADWYTVVLKSSKDMELLFELHDAETGYVLAHKTLGHHMFNVFTVRFGRRKQNSFFTGCLREIRINRLPIDVFAKDRSVDVLQGCQFQPQCKIDSCGHGTCIELWNSFRCECRRPYLPPSCLQELQEATFGKDNVTSNLAYSLQPETANLLASNTEFSFLVRTNKPDGQIFYVGQSGEDDTSTFISCGIHNGTLALDSRLGGKRVQQSRGRRRIDDNIQHLVEVKRKDNNFTIYIDGSKEGQMLITRPFAHPLIVDRIVLGGENPQLGFNQSDESQFKGTLQDVRLNDKNLVLDDSVPNFLRQNQSIGTQIMRQNLLMGTVSDDLCAKKPCVQGTCTNTFNDFVCSCNKGWMGKNCDQVDFCSSSPCAFESAHCINSHGGYVCKAPATFAKTSQSKFLLRQAKAPAKMNEPLRFTFAIRTRTPTAQIVKLSTVGESLSMELKDENVIFRYTNQSTTTEDPLSVNFSNGQWHSVEIFEQEGGQLLASFDNSTIPLLNQFSLIGFLQSNDSWVTFGRSRNATGFKGCLHNVRLGDLPEMSFFSQADSGIRSLNGTPHFESRSLQNIRSDGCHSKDLCGPTNYCRNGALCRDLFNLRKCECPPGFIGDLCEINVDECVDNKDCGSHGKCVDGINSFSCQCNKGYSGPLCATELDHCAVNPCKNGADCKTENGRAVCSCTDDFLGLTCNVKRSAKCKDRPCSNNTLSCTDTDDGFKCECDALFHGELCEESISAEMCEELPCQHGGKCLPAANGTVECICPSNYEGQFCQNLKNACKKKGICGHGKCRSVFGGKVCECDDGYDGISCDLDIDECLEEFPCTNNGSCTNTNGSYSCACPKFYLGKNCEIAGVCAARSPCKNSAECIQKSATEYRCECLSGFTGRNCETEIDYCADEPCLNGATCQRQIGSFKCHCISGFKGPKCEIDIDDCAENEACKNGGQCLDRVNGFECNCLNTGWHGPFCELDLNECQQPDLCQNGECKNLPGTYECTCASGFIGPSCSMVDPCVLDSKNRTLHNCVHGSCVDPRVVQQSSGRYVSEYTCRCYENYTGQFCTHVELIRKPISIGYILGPGIALLIVSILLVCMLFFFVARNRRANQGTYSPSTHEMNGAARVQMHTLQTPLKKQERLI